MSQDTPANIADAAKPERKFAELLTTFFGKSELEYIKYQTSCGPSALDVVRQAVRDAAYEHGEWIRAMYPDRYSVLIELPKYSKERRRRTFISSSTT